MPYKDTEESTDRDKHTKLVGTAWRILRDCFALLFPIGLENNDYSRELCGLFSVYHIICFLAIRKPPSNTDTKIVLFVFFHSVYNSSGMCFGLLVSSDND
eukprot:6455596-Amphidinium_carterae.1